MPTTILFCLSRIPYPLEKGDKLRAYQQMIVLSKHHVIDLFVVAHEDLSIDASLALKKVCRNIYFYKLSKFSLLSGLMVSLFANYPFQVGYFFNSGAKAYFKKIIQESKPGVVFTQLIRMTEYTYDNTYGLNYLDYMDSFSKGMERRMELSKGIKKFFYAWEAKKLKNYEIKISPFYQKRFLISKQDKLTYPIEIQDKITVLPNGVDEVFFTAKKQQKKYDLLFTGNMSYPPNVDAAVYTVKQILPFIVQKYPQVKLYIAGANPAPQVKALEGVNVSVSGWLEDIRDAYNEGKIFIAPLRIGTGLQNKLLEAMSMEVPCISSSLANNALQAKEGEEILIGHSPEEYAQKIIKVMEDTELYEQLAQNGRKFIQKKYNWVAIMNEFPLPVDEV